MLIFIVWWLVAGVGLGASGWFLVIHRPANWFRPAAVNASGWVILIFLSYLRGVVTVLVRGGAIGFRNFSDAAISLGIGALIDVLLVYRVISFNRYRKQPPVQVVPTKKAS